MLGHQEGQSMAQGLPFRFTCPLCGGNTLSLPEGYDDNSIATCGSCGTEMGRLGDLKAMAGAGSQQESGKTPFRGLSSVQGRTRS
jgi:hypothetical protein